MAITILIILAVLYATIALVFYFFQHLFFFRPEILAAHFKYQYPFPFEELEWLKSNALTLEKLKELPKHSGKKRLVFAPTKYVDDHTLSEFRVEFCQLPYEIYRMQK